MKGIASLVVLLLLAACTHKGLEVSEHHPLPRLAVQLEVSLDHEGRGLREPFSFYIVKQPALESQRVGLGGIVIAHDAQGNFNAYDLVCPHCWPSTITVEPLESNTWLLAMQCPNCHTVYDLALGLAHPVEGKGQYPLLQYRTTLMGNRILVN